MKDPHEIIIRPHITERSVALSYGDPRIREEKDIVRKYTFVVAIGATKIEIKSAIEGIYNEGKKKGDRILVEKVNTVTIHGRSRMVRTRRTRFPTKGMTSDFKKAIITLAKGQVLEDFGV